jgi:prepilin-type N-terminal cleavage/methylation domain-containing protein
MRDEAGFSLVEMLMTLIILGILMSISIGVYTHMRDRADNSAAAINVREALGATSLYYTKNDTYSGMNRAELEALANGILLSSEPIVSGDGEKFCIESTDNGRSESAPTDPGKSIHSYTGPAGDIVSGGCPSSL